jgi:hypothetical protein
VYFIKKKERKKVETKILIEDRSSVFVHSKHVG